MHIWLVDTPDYFSEAFLDFHLFVRTADIRNIYGIPVGIREPTQDVHPGIWIEDRDGIFHRVR